MIIVFMQLFFLYLQMPFKFIDYLVVFISLEYDSKFLIINLFFMNHFFKYYVFKKVIIFRLFLLLNYFLIFILEL